MVQPLNYTIGGPDIAQRVAQGFDVGTAIRRQPILEAREQAAFDRKQAEQDQADTRFGQGNVLFEQGQQDRQAQLAAARVERQNAVEMRDDLLVLSENPTAEGFTQLSIKYPQIASEMRQSWDILDGQEQESRLLFMGQLYSSIQSSIKSGDVARTTSMLEERLEALNNTAGREDEARATKAYLETFKADPESARTAVGVAMSVLGGGKFDSLLGKGPAVASSQILADGSAITILRNGDRQVRNPAGDIVTGAEAARTVAAANEAKIALTGGGAGARETAVQEARIDLGGEVAGTIETAKQAVAKSGDMFDQFSKVRTSISNIQSAISAIDEGAKTGLIYKRIPDITKESASLRNALDRMGLDVISATTFGALSEGELRLAMETAAPRNLSAPDLRNWLLEKQTAQESVAAMLLDAAQFLGTPGNTLADWIAKNEAGQQGAESSPDQDADAFFGSNR